MPGKPGRTRRVARDAALKRRNGPGCDTRLSVTSCTMVCPAPLDVSTKNMGANLLIRDVGLKVTVERCVRPAPYARANYFVELGGACASMGTIRGHQGADLPWWEHATKRSPVACQRLGHPIID